MDRMASVDDVARLDEVRKVCGVIRSNVAVVAGQGAVGDEGRRRRSKARGLSCGVVPGPSLAASLKFITWSMGMLLGGMVPSGCIMSLWRLCASEGVIELPLDRLGSIGSVIMGYMPPRLDCDGMAADKSEGNDHAWFDLDVSLWYWLARPGETPMGMEGERPKMEALSLRVRETQPGQAEAKAPAEPGSAESLLALFMLAVAEGSVKNEFIIFSVSRRKR